MPINMQEFLCKELVYKMRLKDHVIVTEIVFGNGYDDVHIWLDELYKPRSGFLHWQHRHHIKAIKEKYGYGTTKYSVAIFHVLCDWFSHCNLHHVPRDENEVISFLKEENLI